MSIRLEGDVQKLKRKLQYLSSLDRKGINKTLAEGVRSSTRQRFKRQVSPEGKRWQPSIRAQAEAGVTLSDSGRLKNSIRARSDASGFAVGTNVIYASTHQLGAQGRTIRAKTAKGLVFRAGGRWVRAKAVRVTIPARPFLGLSEDDMEEIRAAMEAALAKEG